MSSARQPLSGIQWFDIDDPNSPELDELARRFGYHELQVEDCRHHPQRAKTEDHEHYVFAVLKHRHHNLSVFRFEDFDVFVGRQEIVTVHVGRSDVVEKLRVSAEQVGAKTPDRLFYMLLDMIVDEYSPVLDKMAEETSDVEARVLEHPDPDVLARIFRLKRYLIEFRRNAGGMREVVNSLMRREKGLLSDELDPYFRDVYDHLIRTTEFIETYRDLLTGALDIYLSAVANRTNEVMKLLTVWGTVALPLVIITGFFGMNLQLPWTSNPHGIFYALGLMLFTTVAVLVYFRRKHWF